MGKLEKIEEMPFHRKYRPKTFMEFKGNELAVKGIQQALVEGNQHVFLISGPTGTGKTTLARIIADFLLCDPISFYEMDTANTRGIETIREIIDLHSFDPILGGVRVILLDECHQITGAAAEALLKFLEDTPKHVYVIMCTTKPEKLLDTIKNRCSKWKVEPLSAADITKLIDEVLEKEGKTIPLNVKKSIIKSSDTYYSEESEESEEPFDKKKKVKKGYTPRQALVLLEQVINIDGEADQLQIIADATTDEIEVRDICSWIKNKGIWFGREAAGIKQEGLSSKLKKLKSSDPEVLRRSILGWFGVALLNSHDSKEASRIASIMDIFNEPFYDTGRAGLIKACWKALQIP